MRLYLVLLCLGSMIALVNADTLHSISFIHRHGARTSLGLVDGRATCSAPFCHLTKAGIRMCLAVGTTIREAYFDRLGLTGIPYNVSYVHSESTEVPRVVISGEAAVMGMWPDSLPFVDYVPAKDDIWLSPWTAAPTWKIRGQYDVIEARVNNALLYESVGNETLQLIASMTGLHCDVNPIECINYAQDVLAANASAGLPLNPELAAKWDDLRSGVARFMAALLAYDPADEYNRQVGSFGKPQADKMLANIQQGGLHKVHHYAAHDWSLMALYGALGVWTPVDYDNERFVPRFAETLVLEEHRMDGKVYIKAMWGRPNQTLVEHYTMRLAPEKLQCIDANGRNYTSLEDEKGCLLEDMWRYVNTTAPQSPAGQCYATEDMFRRHDCLNSTAAPAEDSRCYFYRLKCPAADCAMIPGAVADIAQGLACVVPTVTHSNYMTTTVIALVAPFALFGAIGGFYGTRRLFGRKADLDESTPIAK